MWHVLTRQFSSNFEQDTYKTILNEPFPVSFLFILVFSIQLIVNIWATAQPTQQQPLANTYQTFLLHYYCYASNYDNDDSICIDIVTQM